MLGRRIAARQPSPTCIPELRRPLLDEWCSIHQDQFNNLLLGVFVQCRSSKAHQTALERFRSGHLRSMTFVQEVKSFFTYPCSLLASPAHLLDFWGFYLRQLYEE
ncbi:uncharacterized protein TNCV_244241 [Trichonephila clavipes]|uniref:Uncharacterized protein n=1 Tax=Trichonephila clavipes TaxID=2585209 RepID=A0A8X6RPI2_TRICX|nr:uncharacterized protein TNCV_244241 [Trichonephila clavipes]